MSNEGDLLTDISIDDSLLARTNFTTSDVHDNVLDSLMKNTQDDAKRFFKNKKLPNYKIRHQLKPTKKLLNCQVSSVVYTNGSDPLHESLDFHKVSKQTIKVPWMGTDSSRFDYGDNVMWDINGESTNLPVFCKMLWVHQGACLVNSPAILARDAGIQVGEDFISIPLTERKYRTEQEEQELKARKRRLSWTLTDEYYSIPQYQYRGKAGTQCDMGVLVNERTFPTYEEKKPEPTPESEDVKPKLFLGKQITTSDIIDHITIGQKSKDEIMSAGTLEKGKDPEKTFIFNSNTFTRCRKVTDSDFKIDTEFNFNNTEPKRLEHQCPKTGAKRTTILTPQPANNSIEVEQFEEYTVTDSSCDTADLNKHVRFDNFTYVQLLSDTVSFDKKLNKKLLPLSNSFRLKKKAKQTEEDEEKKANALVRSKSSLSGDKKEEINPEKLYKRIESVDDDITDILKRYNIRGYSQDPNEQTEGPRSSSPTRLIYNPDTSPFEFDEINESTQITTNENNIYLNSTLTKSADSISARIDLNDLVLDLNLCASSPSPTRTMEPVVSSRAVVPAEPKADYYNHNRARYPLISRAVYKPHSYDNLNLTRDNFNDGSTHRDCSCFTAKDNHENEPSNFKRYNYKSLRVSNIERPSSYSCNLDSTALESSRTTNTARLNEKPSSLGFHASTNVTMKTTVMPKDNNSTHKNLIKESSLITIPKQHQSRIEKMKNDPKFQDKIVLIPAVISSRRPANMKQPNTKLLSVETLTETKQQPKQQASSKMDTEYFQRGRYLRSSYDKSLLMYSHRQGMNDITNNTTKMIDYSTNTKMDKLLQKFRHKLQGLRTSSVKDASNNTEDTLII